MSQIDTQYMTLKEVVAYLGCFDGIEEESAVQRLREAIQSGKLAGSRIPGRGKGAGYRCTKSQVDAYKERWLTPQPVVVKCG